LQVDLRKIGSIARQYWWLLVITTFVAASIAFLTSDRQQPLFAATVTLRVNTPVAASTDFSALQTTQNLTETYRQVIVMNPILDRVVQSMSLPYDVKSLKLKCSAVAVPDTQLLKLTVSDPDAVQAATLANAIAQEFIAYLDEQNTAQFNSTQTLINEQMAEVEQTLDEVRQQIGELESTPASRTDESGLDALHLQESQLLQQRGSLQMQAQSIGLGLAASQEQVSVTEPAVAPATPYAPRTFLMTSLAALVGLAIGIGVVALIEYLDNTIKVDTDIVRIAGAPLLSAISIAPKKAGVSQLFVLTHPRSAATEAIRLLFTNIEFATSMHSITTLAITSAGVGEGKSTITANLGIAMAQSGLKTVVVDADLRQPTQHMLFGQKNDVGLSTLLSHPEMSWTRAGVPVAVPGLVLIPSGPTPPNPSNLFRLDRFDQLLDQLSKAADIILIDTQPLLEVTDSLLVGAKADGVILIGRPAHTRSDRFGRAAVALRQAGVRIIGVVLNQQAYNADGAYRYVQDTIASTKSKP